MNTSNTPKTIFLDFDGVLIGEDGLLSTAAIRELNQLCDETGASLVFITSLRYRFSAAELQAMLVRSGFDPKIACEEVNPSWEDFREAVKNGKSAPGFRGLTKGGEISQYLATHPELERWVIIDDMPHAITPHEHKTIAPRGIFTEEDRLEAMALLGR